MIFVWFMLTVPAALWYLGSRATITSRLWSSYPPKIAAFMDCAACTGFWWGLVVFGFLWGCDLAGGYSWYTAPGWGFASLVTTPLVAYLHDQALYRLGTAVGPTS